MTKPTRIEARRPFHAHGRTYLPGGVEIIPNPSLTIPGEPYQEPRTWRERLFSRPWRPWRATRTVVPQVPDTRAHRIDRSALAVGARTRSAYMAHPETIKRLVAASTAPCTCNSPDADPWHQHALTCPRFKQGRSGCDL